MLLSRLYNIFGHMKIQMKKQLLFIACACLSLGVSAKKHVEKADTGFVFTTVKENPITSIKNQNQSGTCWCFSTLSFFESELLRMGKGEHDLCEMFVVHKTMEDRAAQDRKSTRLNSSH